MTNTVLHHLLIPSEFTTLWEVRDDPSLELSSDVLQWIADVLEDKEALYNLVEGDDKGDSWCSDVAGIVESGVQVPVIRCSQCGRFEDHRRLLPFSCPPILLEHLDTQAFESFAEFRASAVEWEQILLEHGRNVTLCPGDVFAPSVWRDPLRFRQYEFFAPFASFGTYVISERIAARFRQENLRGVLMHDLRLVTRFFRGQISHQFQLLRAVPRREEPEDVSRDMGDLKRQCDHCQGVYYEQQRDLWIAGRKLFSRYRKHRVLPRRHVPDADIFKSQVYNNKGIVLTDRAYRLLDDVELSFATVKEIQIVDDEGLRFPGTC